MKRLSDKLRNDGVNTVIDKYLPGGYDLAQFMGKAPLWPGVKYIVCVCSSLYTQKATNGTGSVGYEKMIVNRELVKQTNTNKFIPILRDNPEGETPDFLGTRFYYDFREDADFETMYQQLLKDILGLSKAPALGSPRKTQTLFFDENADRFQVVEPRAAQASPSVLETVSRLSPEAQKLLIALSNDERGIVVKSVTRAGTKLVCHNLDIPQKTPKDQAKAGEALKQLITLELVDKFGDRGTAWKINNRGFDVADELQGPEIVVIQPPKSELRKIVEKGFGPTR